MTQYDFELQRRVAEIFFPVATKQGDAIYGNANVARFVHYTSAESALSIIRNKCLWMRNTTCMADYREVEHGFEIFGRVFLSLEKGEPFRQALEACAPGCAEMATGLFGHWLSDIRANTYIASVSEHDSKEDSHGRLSMWRGFGGGNIPRVALVFKIPRFSKASDVLKVIFSPVAYLSELEVSTVIETVT